MDIDPMFLLVVAMVVVGVVPARVRVGGVQFSTMAACVTAVARSVMASSGAKTWTATTLEFADGFFSETRVRTV